jgi:hypothetical protein
MSNKKFDKQYKREIFAETINNLMKTTHKIGLSKNSSESLKSILSWAKAIVKRPNNGKM